MSYEDTNCPCGGKKLTDTMLCDACMEYLRDRREWADFDNFKLSAEFRRQAAVILCSLARGRRRALKVN